MTKQRHYALEPRGLSRSDAAAYAGVGTSLFDQLVAEGKMPKAARLRGRVIWDRRAIDRALDALFADTDGQFEVNEWDYAHFGKD